MSKQVKLTKLEEEAKKVHANALLTVEIWEMTARMDNKLARLSRIHETKKEEYQGQTDHLKEDHDILIARRTTLVNRLTRSSVNPKAEEEEADRLWKQKA